MTQAIEVKVELGNNPKQCLVREIRRSVPFLHNGSVHIIPSDFTTKYICYVAFECTPVIKIEKGGSHILLVWKSGDTINPIYLKATFKFESHPDF